MTRVAALDCGTNSLRLLVADVDPATGTLVDVDRRTEVVRLGEGVDRTGRISAEALARTLDVTRFYAALCAQAGVERVRMVATSATRDAGNRDAFVDGVRAVLGVAPEVIAGEEEARLSFAGATGGLAGVEGGPDGDLAPPWCVVDIGGGSTEVVLGAATVTAAASVDVGCVRLTERYLHGDPPATVEVAAAGADVDAALDRVAAAVPLHSAATLVGVAGTVTTVTAHALRLDAHDPARVHGATLDVGAVVDACAQLLHMRRAERAALPYVHPGRVDVIGAGALVWSRVVQRVAGAAGLARVTASEHDILDGIARSLVR